MSRLSVAYLFSWRMYSIGTYSGVISVLSLLLTAALSAVFLVWIVRLGGGGGQVAGVDRDRVGVKQTWLCVHITGTRPHWGLTASDANKLTG